MAVSLETSAVLLALCRVERVSSAIDLGSGFSSYVLRAWAKEAECEVVSVDDNPEWLGRTGEFLMAQGLRSDHLVLWPDYPGRQFDLVFHDLASGALRESAMPAAAGLGRRMVVFDDAQHAGHRRAMTQACAGAGLELYSLRALTLDSIHRYAMIGVL
jgi:predicted O-methyltransferase YrrM